MGTLLQPGRTFINFCPTGMILSRSQNPFVPLTVHEIVSECRGLAKLGVGMIHIHARDEDGNPTWKKEYYQRIIDGIRETNPDIIICVSTSGRLWSDFSKRSAVLDLEGDMTPDMASLTLSSLNFIKSASMNEPQIISDLSRKMADKGIKPELEIFDTGMLNALHVMQKQGILTPPHYINFIFGNIYSMQFDSHIVTYLLEGCPKNAVVAFGGIGAQHFEVTQSALSLDLGVRVGLEDCNNMYYGINRAASNAELVERILVLAQSSGKIILAPNELRTLLQLPRKRL
jgi:uncharacterized protein (DUF849 family)